MSSDTDTYVPGSRDAERFCCGVNLHLGEDGSVLHADYWPRCKSCGRRSGHLEMLLYRRSDGVDGCSYPDCRECRLNNAERLERIGFTITGGDPRETHSPRLDGAS